jgi:type II secretory pathway pseudopilin PulG
MLRRSSGFALLEVIVSMGLIMLIAVSATHSILTVNRLSSRNRVLTAARAVVQRNVDNALSLTWDDSVEPAVLGITTGTAFDDDAGGVAGMVNLVIQKNASGTQIILLQGTLTRIVSAVANSEGADIRRITFRLNYTYQRVNYVVEMTTIRTSDD